MNVRSEEQPEPSLGIAKAFVIFQLDLRPLLEKGVSLNDLVREYRGIPLSDEDGYGIEVPYRVLQPELTSSGSQVFDRREEVLLALLGNLGGVRMCEFLDDAEEQIILGVEPVSGYEETAFLDKVRSIVADVCDPVVTPVQDDSRLPGPGG